MVRDADIVIANCFSKANEMLLAPVVASPMLPKTGGDMVVIAITPEGQIHHYLLRSFGKKFGGRAWKAKGPEEVPTGLPAGTKRLTVLTQFADRVGSDWLAPPDMINWAKAWPEVIQKLQIEYGDKAKVAVIPDATIQYFPEVWV